MADLSEEQVSPNPSALERAVQLAKLLLRHNLNGMFIESDESMTREEAERFASDLEKLGPTATKLGQMLATRADAITETVRKALSRLQSAVKPMPWSAVEAILSEELPAYQDVFVTIDQTPLASASVGQVHTATLRGDRSVVIKVRRPNAKQYIEEDTRALIMLGRALDRFTEFGEHYRFKEMIERFRDSLRKELDYTLEAGNLRRIRSALRGFPLLVVPQPISGLVTERVLVMTQLAGRPLNNVHTIALIERDCDILAEELFRAYLHQLFQCGILHADPHPGNVLILDDVDALGLVDLGSVEDISAAQRRCLIKLLNGFFEHKTITVRDSLLELGEKTDQYDEKAFTDELQDIVARFAAAAQGSSAMGLLLMQLVGAGQRHGVRTPANMMVLARTLVGLEQSVRRLSPQLETMEIIRHQLSTLAATAQSDRSMVESLLDTVSLVENLPSRVSTIIDNVANNEFEISIDAFDQDALMQSIEKIANRITVGALLSAMMLCAAMMMRLEGTSWQLWGYPGIAVVFFLLAGSGALLLVGNVLYFDIIKRWMSSHRR